MCAYVGVGGRLHRPGPHHVQVWEQLFGVGGEGDGVRAMCQSPQSTELGSL